MTLIEQLVDYETDHSHNDADCIKYAEKLIKKADEKIKRWQVIAYNLADEGQIKERLNKVNIKAEIGLSEKEYKELFSE